MCVILSYTISFSDMTPPQSPTETSIDGSSQYLDPRVYYQHHVPSHQFHHRAPCTPGSSPDRSSTSNTPSPLRTPADQGFSPPDAECPRVRSNRMSYSKNQVRCLEAVFLSSPYPDSQAFEILAEELGLPEKKLKVSLQHTILYYWTQCQGLWRRIYHTNEKKSKYFHIFKWNKNNLGSASWEQSHSLSALCVGGQGSWDNDESIQPDCTRIIPTLFAFL